MVLACVGVIPERERTHTVAKIIHLLFLYLMPTVVLHLKKHAAKQRGLSNRHQELRAQGEMSHDLI